MTKTFTKIANGFFSLALSAGVAQAATSTTFFTDRAAFDAEVSSQFDPTGMSTATATTTQAKLDALTSDGKSVELVPLTGVPADPIDFGDYHLTNPWTTTRTNGGAHLFSILNPGIGAGMIAGYAIGNPVSENHGWSFDIDVFAFGFDWFDPNTALGCVVTCGDSSFLMRAFDAADNLLGEATDPGVYGGLSFFGVTSDTGIRRLELIETGVVNFDNEYFGNYVTGSIAAVPVPLSLPLLAGGLGLLGALGARRRAASGQAA